MISHLGKTLLFLGILVLGGMPVLYLILSNDSLNTEAIQQISHLQNTFDISLKTAGLSTVTAIISSIIGLGIALTLRSSRHTYHWIALYILCFSLSPYIAAQGWIQIGGAQGSLWKLLSMDANPRLLFSSYGLVFLMCLQFIPLSLLIFVCTLKHTDRETLDLKRLTHPPRWKSLYFYHLRPNIAPLLFSILLIFWLAFWNYETPSILRQNTYALSLYAAFGSFYDYNQALGYLSHVLYYGIPTLILILWLTPSLSNNIRSLTEPNSQPRHWVFHISSTILLLSVPLCILLIPLSGLLSDLEGMDSLLRYAKNYSGDIKNTLIVSSTSSLIAVTLCLALTFISSKLNARTILSIGALALLMIPPLCSGIGAVHWFAENVSGEAGLERIILVNSIVLLPILLLPTSLAFPEKSHSQTDTLHLLLPSPFKKLLIFTRPIIMPRVLLLFGFGFLMVMKEVPASILNYPPDGSTLSLTIETMLHFDQPKLISGLCLIQLCISLSIFTIISILYRLCKQ